MPYKDVGQEVGELLSSPLNPVNCSLQNELLP